jgi:S1-C subfamily serine protease
VNLVDLVVILLGVAAAVRGRSRGLLAQVFELGGGFLGLLAGVALGGRIADAFTQDRGLNGLMISLFVVFAMLSIGQTVGYYVGHRFGKAAHDVRLGPVDRGLGAAFSVMVLLVTFWLVGSLLVGGSPSRTLAKEVRDSAILRATNAVLPDPPNVLAYIQKYLDDSGFPQVFTGMPPISPPVDLPSNAEANQAIEAVQPSTVRIVVPACGGTQLGSGWVAAPEYVITNAHVVAGGDAVTIQSPSGEAGGTIVLFDPKIDIAVVHAPGLGAPAIDLDTTEYERGEPGATLGYPGAANGELKVHRAAVQEVYNANGRDIYGRSEVTRRVYELRSPVRQGDSGGPFALPNGSVAGMVFAASTTDGRIGYALTGAEIENKVARGTRRTAPVSAGRCTH